MRKIRVDFVAHHTVVVAVNEGDDMYDKAEQLAQSYVDGSPMVRPRWEVEDDGVGDADDDADIDVEQRDI